jgi:hypothetical protein
MRTIYFISVLLVGAISFFLTHQLPAETVVAHHCNWAGCDYKGLTELPTLYNPIDSIHFEHPNWDYDKCESLCK